MTECKCCNDLGSRPKYQLFLTICITVLAILLSLYGISFIMISQEDISIEYDVTAHDIHIALLFVTYYVGFLVSIVWLVTCISRCCAPCCCELSDVPCPCPCTSFGLLDLCFFVGFIVAMWPVNASFMYESDPDFALFDGMVFADGFIIVFLGILMLCVAIPLGCIKFKKMQEKGRESTYPVQQAPQVVGSAVVVNHGEPV